MVIVGQVSLCDSVRSRLIPAKLTNPGAPHQPTPTESSPRNGIPPGWISLGADNIPQAAPVSRQLDCETRKADVNEGIIGTAWMNNEQFSQFLIQGCLVLMQETDRYAHGAVVEAVKRLRRAGVLVN